MHSVQLTVLRLSLGTWPGRPEAGSKERPEFPSGTAAGFSLRSCPHWFSFPAPLRKPELNCNTQILPRFRFLSRRKHGFPEFIVSRAWAAERGRRPPISRKCLFDKGGRQFWQARPRLGPGGEKTPAATICPGNQAHPAGRPGMGHREACSPAGRGALTPRRSSARSAACTPRCTSRGSSGRCLWAGPAPAGGG